MSQGWIKLHRELMDKAIWKESTPEQKTILITLLMMANHKEKEWEWKGERFKAEPGQFVTSLPSIAEKCGKGISIQNVRTALKRFEKYEFLTDESTNKNRLITIVNWELYQETDNKSTGKLTGNQQATNRQLTANKNDKNVRNKRSPKQVYDESSPYYVLANYFLQQIRRNNPNHKTPNMQKWSDDIRKMIELDKRTEKQVRYLMRWVQEHDFWAGNVLSPAKLREKFDQLVIQVKKENKVQPINTGKTPEQLEQERLVAEMRARLGK